MTEEIAIPTTLAIKPTISTITVPEKLKLADVPKAIKLESFNNVDECLKAGYSWEKCVGLKVTEGGMILEIKKTCPLPMLEELKRRAFSGEDVAFRTEREKDV